MPGWWRRSGARRSHGVRRSRSRWMRGADMYTLDDRAILVTGGGRGLGAAICEVLAKEGANVFVGERDPDTAEKSAKRLRDQGLSADAVVMDVGSDDDIARAMRQVH